MAQSSVHPSFGFVRPEVPNCAWEHIQSFPRRDRHTCSTPDAPSTRPRRPVRGGSLLTGTVSCRFNRTPPRRYIGEGEKGEWHVSGPGGCGSLRSCGPEFATPAGVQRSSGDATKLLPEI